MYFYAPSARVISIEIVLYLLIFNKKFKNKQKSKLMTKTTFSTYHVNICTDMGYMFMMTKKQSVKQININKNVLNDY
jgi:hypothetical protein